MSKTGAVVAVLCLFGAAKRGEAAVLFENPGTLMGWSRVYAQEQGTNTLVSSPTFEGPSALKATQTFAVADGRGYHSERVVFDVQRNGQDQYYGVALYLPPDWVFHNQNVTFQQWAFENPGGGGPWILMFVQNDKLRMGGSGASGSRDIATITNLRGTWIRIVTRINMTATGPFEVWVNGTKSLSAPINLTVGGDPPTIRWSTGIYCTAWRTQQPAGGSPISVWHDQFRVATTHEEAEPANWGNRSSTDAGAVDASTPSDATVDVRVEDAAMAGAGGTGGAGTGGGRGEGGIAGSTGGAGGATGGAAGGPATGGRGGAGGTPGEATGGAEGEGAAPRPSRRSAGGCAVGARAEPAGLVAVVMLLVAAAGLRRQWMDHARSSAVQPGRVRRSVHRAPGPHEHGLGAGATTATTAARPRIGAATAAASSWPRIGPAASSTTAGLSGAAGVGDSGPHEGDVRLDECAPVGRPRR
jgi:hypothetical protein